MTLTDCCIDYSSYLLTDCCLYWLLFIPHYLAVVDWLLWTLEIQGKCRCIFPCCYIAYYFSMYKSYEWCHMDNLCNLYATSGDWYNYGPSVSAKMQNETLWTHKQVKCWMYRLVRLKYWNPDWNHLYIKPRHSISSKQINGTHKWIKGLCLGR